MEMRRVAFMVRRGLLLLSVLLIVAVIAVGTGVAQDKQVYYDTTWSNHNNACASDSTEDARQTLNAPETFRLTEFTYFVANVINPTTIRARVYRMSDSTLLGEDTQIVTDSYDFNFTFPEIQIDENMDYASYEITFSIMDGSGWGTYFQYGESFYDGGEAYCCCGLGSRGGADYYGKMYGIPGPTPSPTQNIVDAGTGMAGMFTALEGPLPGFLFSFLVVLALVSLVATIAVVVVKSANKIKGR